MKYLEFSVGKLPGFIIELDDDFEKYEFLNSDDKEEIVESFLQKLMREDVYEYLSPLGITLGWGDTTNNTILICICFGSVPEQVLETAVLKACLHREEFKTVREKQCYALPSLTTLFSLPKCKGYITQGKKEYHLHTTSVLDDFLDKRQVSPNEQVVIEDIEKFFDIF